MGKTIILAKRPDLVLKLEKYGLLPKGKKGGIYEGSAKKWAKAKTAPYDTPVYQAMAERLPTGWEELTEEEMKALLKSLREAINRKKREKLDLPNKGCEKMLKNLSQLAFLGMEIVSSLLTENGIGMIPDKDEKEKERAMEFSFELTLHFIEGTGFLTHLFRNIAETTNTSFENQELIAEVLKAAAIFLSMLAAANGNEDKIKTLLLSFKPRLSKRIATIENFVSGQLEKGAIRGETAERAALYLQQAKVSLDAEDPEGLYEAFIGALEMMNIDQEELMRDVNKIREFGREIKNSVQAALNDTSNQITAISQSM